MARLSNVLNVQNGFAFDSELFAEGDGVPLVRIRDLPRSRTEATYTGPFRDEFLIHDGDYLIGMDGDFGCYQWGGPTALLNQRVCRLTNFAPVVEPRYIYYWINDELAAIQHRTAFVTVKHLSSKQILDLEIDLPPLSEQRRIVEILDQADAIRKKRTEADKLTERILPALFYQMFGDPATNPRRWPVLPLADLASSGPQYGANASSDVWTPGAPRYVRITDVDDKGRLREDSVVTVAAGDWAEYALRPGDLLFARSGATVGKTFMYRESHGPCVFAGYMIRFGLDTSQIEPWVAFAYTQTPHYLAWVAVKKRSAAQPNINGQEYAGLLVPRPDRALQRRFAAAANGLEALAAKRRSANAQMEATQSTLLHRAFSGELTAKWREKNKALVEREMVEQKRVLEARRC